MRIGRIFGLFFLLLLISPGVLRAQRTAVSATLTDPQGLPLRYGSVKAVLISPGGAVPSLSGIPVTGMMGPTGLDFNGFFQFNLPDNNAVTPAGTQWQFTICPIVGLTCIQTTLTITGASMDLTATLNAALLKQITQYPLPYTASALTTLCSTAAVGSKDIIPQTCAGAWTLQGLVGFPSNVVFQVYFPSTNVQKTNATHFGDLQTSFDNTLAGDGLFTAQQYLTTTAVSTSGSLNPLDKLGTGGTAGRADGYVVYAQQLNNSTGGVSKGAAIKGIFDLFGQTTSIGTGLYVGVAGKIIYSTNGALQELRGLSGETFINPPPAGSTGTIQIVSGLAAVMSNLGSPLNAVQAAFGLRIPDMRNYGAVSNFAWGYQGSAFALPSSFLDNNNNLVIGNTVNAVAGSANVNGPYLVNLTATAALSAGQTVKIDTANDRSVVVGLTTDTGGGVIVGLVTNSPGAGFQATVAIAGLVNTLAVLGTGTCTRGQFVIQDTTTNGRVQCTSTFTAGTVVGKAITAQSVVGNTLSVLVEPR